VSVRLRRHMKWMGWLLGSDLRKTGGEGRSRGSLPVARVMADWTSIAAASMSRSRSNCSVRLLWPCMLREVTSSRPEICKNSFSSGVATFAAIMAASIPGKETETWMTG